MSTNRLPISTPALTPPSQFNALDALAADIEKRTLMQFAVERRSLFISVVTARAKAAGYEDVSGYVRYVLSPFGQTEWTVLVDELTINETTFFRNVPQLNLLSQIVLPEIMGRKKAAGEARQLRLWSAACSTGQEVYTLAMLALEAARTIPSWDVQILGTDISPTVIGVAQQGLYPKKRLDTIPPAFITRYFDDLGEQLRVKDELRRATSFRVHNLRETPPPATFDVIFCRNVMIYFSREEQAKLVARFRERLAPGGYLFIGHSESLQGLDVDLRLRIQGGGVAYQKG